MSSNQLVPLVIASPVMSQRDFAETMKVTPETVRGLVQTKQIPSKKIGRYRLINIAALTAECLQEAGLKTTFTEER